jgi:uncharacterized protein Usg
MPDLSAIIPDSHHHVSRGFVDILIQTQREKLFTGLMHLHYPSGRNLVFSFLDGVRQKLYTTHEQTIEAVSRQFWSSYLDFPDTSIGFLSLTIEALRMARVIYETPVTGTEQISDLAGPFSANLEKWITEPFPSIVRVEGESANRFYLVSGFSTPVIEELSVLGDQAHFAVNDATFAKALPQTTQYQITRYVSDSKHDVWQEYELRFAFNPLMHMLVTRFSELAGRILTERLCAQLASWIQDAGWRINITTNGVMNHHYFESLEEARSAYLKIVRNFNELASPAIGPRMARGLARDILLKLNPYHRSLLQRHVYELYDVDNAAVWAGGIQV